MKHFFNILICFSFSTFIFAQDVKPVRCKAMLKATVFSLSVSEIEIELQGLIDQNKFESKYFKIVNGQSNNSIAINTEDEDLKLKAATVYHNAYKTYSFWEKHQPVYLKDMPKLIIRLNIHNEKTSDYTATNIEQKSNELWFGKFEETDVKELDGFVIPTPISDFANKFRGSSDSFFVSNIKHSTVEHIIYPEYASSSLTNTYLINIGFMVIANLSFSAIKYQDYLIQGNKFYHDPAFVPESVIGSITKLLMFKNFKQIKNIPVINGVSDFYTTMILDSSIINKAIDKYYYGSFKRRVNEKKYKFKYEYDFYNQEDFVLSLLWKVKKEFPIIGHQLIFNSRKFLTEDSTINNNLLQSLLFSCDELCHNPFKDKLRLHRVFNSKGF